MSKFSLEVTTWENDGDEYSTQIILGLTQADVEFYVDLATTFKSKNARHNAGMGNEEHELSVYHEHVSNVMERHPNISWEVHTEWTEALEDEEGALVYELLCETILGDPVQYDYGFARVYDRHEVIDIASAPLNGLTANWVKANPNAAYEMLVQLEQDIKRLSERTK